MGQYDQSSSVIGQYSESLFVIGSHLFDMGDLEWSFLLRLKEGLRDLDLNLPPDLDLDLLPVLDLDLGILDNLEQGII